MPTLDATAKTAVAGSAASFAFFIWLDIVGDPLRITTLGADITPSGAGDAEFDGALFHAFDARAIRVGDVSNSENGSDTLEVELSGITSIPEDLMQEIADTTKWRGRTCRLWMRIYDETGTTPQGGYVPYYTGYASSVKVKPSPETQTILMEIENYLAGPAMQASNRSYLNQKDYDSTDTSAQATLAAANMGRGAAVKGGSGGSLSGGVSGGIGGHYDGQRPPSSY